MKQDWKSLISMLEKEIGALQDEIKKREAVLQHVKSFQGTSAGVVRRRPGRKPGRKPGRPAVVKKTRMRRRPGRPVLKPGRKPGRRPGRPARGIKKPKTADLMVEILSRMSQPASIDDLAQKFHALYPKLGGVKYRSVIASITSRDSRFSKLKGNKVSLK